jgi:hypothetical protein
VRKDEITDLSCTKLILRTGKLAKNAYFGGILAIWRAFQQKRKYESRPANIVTGREYFIAE